MCGFWVVVLVLIGFVLTRRARDEGEVEVQQWRLQVSFVGGFVLVLVGGFGSFWLVGFLIWGFFVVFREGSR